MYWLVLVKSQAKMASVCFQMRILWLENNIHRALAAELSLCWVANEEDIQIFDKYCFHKENAK